MVWVLPISLLSASYEANRELRCGNDGLEFGPATLSTPRLWCGKGPAIAHVLKGSVSRPEPGASSALSSILVGVRRAAGKPQKGFNNARDLTLSTCSLWARPRDIEVKHWSCWQSSDLSDQRTSGPRSPPPQPPWRHGGRHFLVSYTEFKIKLRGLVNPRRQVS